MQRFNCSWEPELLYLFHLRFGFYVNQIAMTVLQYNTIGNFTTFIAQELWLFAYKKLTSRQGFNWPNSSKVLLTTLSVHLARTFVIILKSKAK